MPPARGLGEAGAPSRSGVPLPHSPSPPVSSSEPAQTDRYGASPMFGSHAHMLGTRSSWRGTGARGGPSLVGSYGRSGDSPQLADPFALSPETAELGNGAPAPLSSRAISGGAPDALLGASPSPSPSATSSRGLSLRGSGRIAGGGAGATVLAGGPFAGFPALASAGSNADLRAQQAEAAERGSEAPGALAASRPGSRASAGAGAPPSPSGPSGQALRRLVASHSSAAPAGLAGSRGSGWGGARGSSSPFSQSADELAGPSLAGDGGESGAGEGRGGGVAKTGSGTRLGGDAKHGSGARLGGDAKHGSGARLGGDGGAFSPPPPSAASPSPLPPVAPPPAPPAASSDAGHAISIGLINAAAGVPSLVAYAAIVFQDPVYESQLDLLCKFFFLSSAVHQLVFCALSTLPFAIGQVQDVGLIFLSAMATSIATLCAEGGYDEAEALGTSLVAMSIATAVVGAATIVVARKHWASVVQYVPLPVIGGYLGFVGYFCIAAGSALAAGVSIESPLDWLGILGVSPLEKMVCMALSCALLMLAAAKAKSALALPGTLLAIVLAFHLGRLALGASLEDAMDAGWVLRPAAGSQRFWELWKLFHLVDEKTGRFSIDGICWPAVARQAGKVVGLILVVCFGSCMDVAAIQQDVPEKLDFDRELTTVGVSNIVVSALGCGYTGSYIFSQTIFTMRSGVRSRLNGLVVAAVELVMFFLPFPVVQYMPNFFFGALLCWFGIEISLDWLVHTRRLLSAIEYALLWLTFAAVMRWGLEGGIAAGIVLATLYFAYAYARSQVSGFGPAAGGSDVIRTADQARALDALSDHVATTYLNGFVFFGSAHAIATELEAVVDDLVQGNVASGLYIQRQGAEAEAGAAADADAEAAANAADQNPTALPFSLPPASMVGEPSQSVHRLASMRRSLIGSLRPELVGSLPAHASLLPAFSAAHQDARTAEAQITSAPTAPAGLANEPPEPAADAADAAAAAAAAAAGVSPQTPSGGVRGGIMAGLKALRKRGKSKDGLGGAETKAEGEGGGEDASAAAPGAAGVADASSASTPPAPGEDDAVAPLPFAASSLPSPSLLPAPSSHVPLAAAAAALTRTTTHLGPMPASGAPDEAQALAAASAASPRFLIVDFSAVRGVDATAARALTALLVGLQAKGVVGVVTGVDDEARGMLRAHGLGFWSPADERRGAARAGGAAKADGAAEATLTTPLLGAGDEAAGALPGAEAPWAGEAGGAGGPSSPGAAEASAALSSSSSVPSSFDYSPLNASFPFHWGLLPPEDHVASFGSLQEGVRYAEDRLLAASVSVGLCAPPTARRDLVDALRAHLSALPILPPSEAPALARTLLSTGALEERHLSPGEPLWSAGDPARAAHLVLRGSLHVRERQGAAKTLALAYDLGPGCVAGVTDYILARPHATAAQAGPQGVTILRASHASLAKLAKEHPEALLAFETLLARANTLDLTLAAERASLARGV